MQRALRITLDLHASTWYPVDVATRHVKLSDQIRRAIDASGMSRYAIAKAIDLDQSVLSRFMAGTSGLSVQNLDRLGKLLGLKLVAEDRALKAKRTVKNGDDR